MFNVLCSIHYIEKVVWLSNSYITIISHFGLCT